MASITHKKGTLNFDEAQIILIYNHQNEISPSK
jgi:hypothetical protein